MFSFGGLNGSHCGIELGETTKSYTTPSTMARDPFCQIVGVSTPMSGPTVTKYLNLLHFRPEKGISGPLRPKGRELGGVIMNLWWPRVSVIRKY